MIKKIDVPTSVKIYQEGIAMLHWPSYFILVLIFVAALSVVDIYHSFWYFLMFAVVIQPRFSLFLDIFTSLVNICNICNLLSHTKGHISYYVTGKEDEHPAVFTGDTLVR